ncbi:MAG: 2-phospho-L-lactate transferase [Gammaproteobacteria bacterium]
MNAARGSVVVLSGGVGGAKLVLGLTHVVPADKLVVVANTGDDFEHAGLRICPDIDTLMYTLAGEVNEETGWGRRDETWSFMDALERLGGETWFRLGDRDLATHIRRTQLLVDGAPLSSATADLCRHFGVRQRIVPMSDRAVRTRVIADTGVLDFQHYFVRERAAPRVRRLEYVDAGSARPTDAALAALRDPTLAGIVVAPSNPYLSIAPILAIPAMRAAIRAAAAPVVAISPIVGDTAIKGPTAKIMRELGQEVSARGVAEYYGDLLDGFIVDASDGDAAPTFAGGRPEVAVRRTVMRTLDDKIALARDTLALLDSLAHR